MLLLKRIALGIGIIVLGVLMLGTLRQYHPSWPAVVLATVAAAFCTRWLWRMQVPAATSKLTGARLSISDRALLGLAQAALFGLAYLLIQYPVLGTLARHTGTTAAREATLTGWEPNHRYGRHRMFACLYVRADFTDSHGRRTKMAQCMGRGPKTRPSMGATVWLVSTDSWLGSLTTGDILMVREPAN